MDIARGKVNDLFEQFVLVKAVVVGKAKVGKTAVVKRITNQWNWVDRFLSFFFNFGWRTETDGIAMHSWDVQLASRLKKKIMRYSLWDFAGQRFYYTSHQFFLTDNSINIIVFDIRNRLEESDITIWLNSIRTRTKYSKVVLIATHLDKISTKKKEETIFEKEKELVPLIEEWKKAFSVTNQMEFQNFRYSNSTIHFLPISNTTSDTVQSGRDELMAALQRIGSSFIARPLDTATLNIKDRIEKEVGKRAVPMVTLSEFNSWIAEEWKLNENGNLIASRTYLKMTRRLFFKIREPY